MKIKPFHSARRSLLAQLGLVTILGISGAGPVLAQAQAVLQDSFTDGDFTSNPSWKPLKGTWQVQDGALYPAGDAEFSSIRTEEFAPLQGGGFQLSFEVKFKDASATGRNRILVGVRDKGGKGYQIELSQGTANNTIITRLDPATVTLTNTLLSPAAKFPADAFIPVQFSKSPEGELKVTVNGLDYLTAQDNAYREFTQVQLSSRSPDAQQVQGFDNVRLSNPGPQTATGATMKPAGTQAEATPNPARAGLDRKWYQPAPLLWLVQEVDFTQYRKKPSAPLGEVVARGTSGPIRLTTAQLLAPQGTRTVRLDLARGFQGAPAGTAEMQIAPGQDAINLPSLAPAQYWMTARFFGAAEQLVGHKVFF